MIIAKQIDWQSRLIGYLAEVRARAFNPSDFHCAYFAAGAVEAMTGCDLAAPWRGRAKTMAGGLRILRRAGFADHVALAAHHFAEIIPAFAQPGDIAVLEADGGAALGIVQGAAIYVLRPDGLGLVSLLTARRAFRVN